MSSRDAILEAIRRGKPDPAPLPEEGSFDSPGEKHKGDTLASRGVQATGENIRAPAAGFRHAADEDTDALTARFGQALEDAGGQMIETSPEKAASVLAARYPDQTITASSVSYISAHIVLHNVQNPHDLDPLDLLVCEGTVGVAENGAIWVPESRLVHRAAPFLAEHLVILLDRRRLVWNMHQAYARLRVDAEGFGLFIAGPSKTADIGQVLVIGAHGPRSCTVLLTGQGK